MTNTVVKTPGYSLSPTFNHNNNVGVSLIKIGVPNALVNTVVNSIKQLIVGAHTYLLKSDLKNIEFNSSVISWAEMEFMVVPVQLEEPSVFDSFEQFDIIIERIASTQPYVISELDLINYAHSGKSYFRSINNRDNTGELDVYHPEEGILFEGVQTKHNLTGTDFIRVTTLHTSKYLPVVESYMSVDMVEPRQAPVLQLSPYSSETHQLDCFAMGNTGSDLIEELKSTSLFVDTIPLDTYIRLVTMAKNSQYRVARVLATWRKLYGKLTVPVVCSVIENLPVYSEVIAALESEYQPTNETLNSLFASTPARQSLPI